MTIVHIVIAKFKPEVSEEIKQQALVDVLALKDTIPQIKSASAGKTFTDRSKGFEYSWVVELDTKEELGIYAEAPSHVDFVKKYRPMMDDLIAVDYEK
ncbi:stress responsive A/B barrel domain-containing protein [Halteromyces radiatus]|uniref:stress responsive A/B barrel domain-containing protein n=1 Tax=Halteromyces radiatus TaxID=101107 RepID=UPI00221EA1CF|nr:stress responsive A/B barrel domain-containing protein [Halteromyces radiatus]KAI8100052.1 stress responsive A/B barrel domain-containing protein [Halteromyces radiatus]